MSAQKTLHSLQSGAELAAPFMQAWLVPYAHIDTGVGRSPLTPRVHRGFLASWHRDRLHRRVVDHVQILLDRRKTANLADMRVVITGASLKARCWQARCRAVS